MIDVTALTEEDKGKSVQYTAMDMTIECGIITSWNEYYVFVRYTKEGIGQATSPSSLDWIS